MNTFNIGNTREVCWDNMLIDKNDGISIKLHKPVRKNTVMTCNEEWEGFCCGYFDILKVGNTYRLYYGAGGQRGSIYPEDNVGDGGRWVCMAESLDGKTFTKPKLCKFTSKAGSKINNIIHLEERYIDNFTIFYDENPDCPPDAKYKALSMCPVKGDPWRPESANLAYYTSPDGINFTGPKALYVNGEFDSFNVFFWDKATKQYFLYVRDEHEPKEKNDDTTADCENVGRHIHVYTSKDFNNWQSHGLIKFDDNKEDYQLYTNGVHKYYRSENIFLGIITRYLDRKNHEYNFKHVGFDKRDRFDYIKELGREGTALTDAVLMTSRDGFYFDRCDEVFMSPGIQNGINWIYGDCYIGYGFIETESDYKGEPNEISLYSGLGYHTRPVDVVRYTLRLDGFFSWHADYCGGEVLTKPICFDGDKLSINFETSAMGHIRIKICDENGCEIEGYDSNLVFGNSVDRMVDFEKDVSLLKGKNVRLKIEMKDAELYSFIFC